MNKEMLADLTKKIDNIFNKKESSPIKYNNINLANLVFGAFGSLFRNFKSFLTIGCVFAPLIAFLSFATGNSFICGFSSQSNLTSLHCSAANVSSYITFLLLRFLIISVFLRAWYNLAVQKQNLNIKSLLLITNQDWKLFATIILFIIINILPLISFMFMTSRVPNPDWKIESIWFAVMSCGFIIPFLAIRFYSAPSFIISQTKLPAFGLFIKQSNNNGLKLLFSFAIIIMFCSLITTYYVTVFPRILPLNTLSAAILGEIIYDFLLLAIAAILINYSVTQREELFHE